MSPSPDLFTEAADLIRDVGERSQEARRYRDLATAVAEPAFERTLALGTIVRRWLRTGTSSPPAVIEAVTELRGLLARCEDGIGRVRSSERYGDLVNALRQNRLDRVGELASAVFTDVTPYPQAATIFWTLPLSGKRRADHFLPPDECAARIRDLAARGIPAASPPADMGADDQVQAVVLSSETDPSESPLALAIDARQLPVPPCRLVGTPIVLSYGSRLRAPFTVSSADTSSDEWWSAGRDTYPAYLRQLRHALAPSGIRIDGALANG